MTITYKVELITPAMAEKMLKLVHPRQAGRHIQSAIDGYAAAQKAGEWNEDVMQTISFDDHGQLIDGYHRLQAIRASGKSIKFLVVRGVSKDAFSKYDAGRARSLAFRTGVDKDRIAAINMIRRIVRFGTLSSVATPEEVELINQWVAPVYERFISAVPGKRKSAITAAPVRTGALLNAVRQPAFEDVIFAAYTALVTVDLSAAPRSMSTLYRRLTETRNDPLTQLVLSWRAFDPTKFDNQKIQINSVGEIVHEIRREVLADLVGALS